MSYQSGKTNDNFSGSWQKDDKWKWNQSGTKKWADIQDKDHVSVDGHGHYDIHSKIAHFHTDEHEHDSYVKMDSLGFIDIGGLYFNDGSMQSSAFPSPIGNSNKLLYSDGLSATWKDGDEFKGLSLIYSASPPSDPNKNPLWVDTNNKQFKFYDGSIWKAPGAEEKPGKSMDVFSVAGTYTWDWVAAGKPNVVYVSMIGGGGGGSFGWKNQPWVGPKFGESGANGLWKVITKVSVSSDVTVVVGEGGAGGYLHWGLWGLMDGGSGGSSKFGALVIGGGTGGDNHYLGSVSLVTDVPKYSFPFSSGQGGNGGANHTAGVAGSDGIVMVQW